MNCDPQGSLRDAIETSKSTMELSIRNSATLRPLYVHVDVAPWTSVDMFVDEVKIKDERLESNQVVVVGERTLDGERVLGIPVSEFRAAGYEVVKITAPPDGEDDGQP